MIAADSAQTLLSLGVSGAVTVLGAFIVNWFTRRNQKDVTRTDIYKAELENMNRQREAVSVENEKLRDALREELDDCRRLRQLMEDKLEEMVGKINTIEAELFAWRNGLRTPSGYVLVRIPEEKIEPT